MILDSLQNAAKYYGLHPNFKKAFDYVNQNDIANLEEGAFEIGKRFWTSTCIFNRSNSRVVKCS